MKSHERIGMDIKEHAEWSWKDGGGNLLENFRNVLSEKNDASEMDIERKTDITRNN